MAKKALPPPPEMDESPVSPASQSLIRIVGIGGSAGGLEAFEQFFSNMPADSGMAFVVVSHLDPSQKGALPELIQRSTAMKVHQVEEGMAALPNCIYVIPPNRDLSIKDGLLYLAPQAAYRYGQMPIDCFFRSLAEEKKEMAVAIVLSGMGTDGTLGIKSIKENLGMVMAQDMESAKFNSMPASAIATGLTDYVAPATALPERLMAYVRSAGFSPASPEADMKSSDLERIIILLRSHVGHDFSCYKPNTLHRRIERRMGIHHIRQVHRYVRFLQDNVQERTLLFKELLIGVTNFFRDPEAYDVLSSEILPLLEARRHEKAFRVWIPGCSTGEEAYSIAMMIHECLKGMAPRPLFKVHIFATDLDGDAIEKARAGVYPANIAADVTPERLKRYFIEDNKEFHIQKEIREMLVFAKHNIIMDPPFTRLDLLCCRNLLIYFNSMAQKKLMPLFHYALNPEGLLFLGSSENVSGFSRLFSPVHTKWRIFRRKESSFGYPGSEVQIPVFPGIHLPETERLPAAKWQAPASAIPLLVQKHLLDYFSASAVLVNADGDIVYVHGHTGKYLEHPSGNITANLFAMAREGLRYELSGALRAAAVKNAPAAVKGLEVKTNDGFQTVNVTVLPTGSQDLISGNFLVIFEAVQKPKRKRAKKTGADAVPAEISLIARMEAEIHQLRERLKTTIDEAQTSREELKSANEELQSSNEELQSTNEELTTSKEEMQSLNEELMSVNTEFQNKIEDLSAMNTDMKNLLNSTEIATIFLDNDLKIRRFTASAVRIINMIGSDIGRYVGHIVSNLRYDGLVADIRQVLDTLVFRQTEVQTQDGTFYLMRIIPYRTSDNRIDGVTLTFVDITHQKNLQAALQTAWTLAENIIQKIPQPLLILDECLKVKSANWAFYEFFRLKPGDVEKKPFFSREGGLWGMPEFKQLVEELPRKTQIQDFPVTADFPQIGLKHLSIDASPVQSEDGSIQMALLTFRETDESSP